MICLKWRVYAISHGWCVLCWSWITTYPLLMLVIWNIVQDLINFIQSNKMYKCRFTITTSNYINCKWLHAAAITSTNKTQEKKVEPFWWRLIDGWAWWTLLPPPTMHFYFEIYSSEQKVLQLEQSKVYTICLKWRRVSIIINSCRLLCWSTTAFPFGFEQICMLQVWDG